MTLVAHVVHGQQGWELRVQRIPWWGVASEEAVDGLCGWTAHLLCGAWAWPYRVGLGPVDENGLQAVNLGNAWWRVGQRVLGWRPGERVDLWTTSLSVDDARQLVPWTGLADDAETDED